MTNIRELLWVEKYRPKEYNEVVGLDTQIESLVKSLPHLLLVGPAGTGKTTLAKIIIEKGGYEALRLNASDERGIQTIRDNVKGFAMSQSMNDKLKVVFLDEADALTSDAQTCLRNLMESYASNCRFILTGNYDNKIIDPIQSRCIKITFKDPPVDGIIKRLHEICVKEDIKLEKESVLQMLADKTYPDIRKAISQLQKLSHLGRPLVESDVKDEHETALSLFLFIQAGDFKGFRSVYLNASTSEEELVKQLYELVISSNKSLDYKREFVYEAAECLKNMNFVSSKNILFECFAWRVMNIEKTFNKNPTH